MSGIYILLMVWSTGSYRGGVAFASQEFTSYENCEIAHKVMLAGHDGAISAVRAHGCFKK